ncbi:MAG: hypothetical protein QOH38_252 [Thermoleophilaceae bacterium]|nr:hypothetical protein [Thermoleophilaceae bacterium]
MGRPRLHGGWVAALAVASGLLVCAVPAGAHTRVLRVGTYKGVKGHYHSIQAAIDAAHRGDWILVGPGDDHERADRVDGIRWDAPAGVVIAKRGIHLRGMQRNRVVVDGTKPGARRCSRRARDQDFGVKGSDGNRLGRNGILVWKADHVSIENLTVCNFLARNEIWWNGGDGSGKIVPLHFHGAYLNATSTYYKDDSTAAGYGIFSSNASGGTWNWTYASNMADSDYYIGACAQVCDQVVNHAHAQYSSLGYSGTNAGGHLVVKNSEFDHNGDGFDTNSQNNDDRPSPQTGLCPGGKTSPITHTHSCWVFMHNYVHDNNNANVPRTVPAPTGTGLSVAGGRDDTIVGNRFERNGAWGVVFVPYPDVGDPPPGATCQGGTQTGTPPNDVCLYDDWDNALLHNSFKHNGSFGNDTNGDVGELTSTAAPSNCYRGNVEAGGGQVTTSPSGLQQSKPTCGGTVPPDQNPPFFNQIACDSQVFAGIVPGTSQPCPPGASYPQRTKVVMPRLPHSGLRTMPHPCRHVPANPWCPT